MARKSFDLNEQMQDKIRHVEMILYTALEKDEGIKKYISKRQYSILKMVLSGKTNKEIAEQLNLVERTIEYHRSCIMRVFNVPNMIELLKLIFAMGMNE